MLLSIQTNMTIRRFGLWTITSFEQLERFQKKLDEDPEWEKCPTDVKDELIKDIQAKLTENIFDRHLDELQEVTPSPPKRKRGRPKKEIETGGQVPLPPLSE